MCTLLKIAPNTTLGHIIQKSLILHSYQQFKNLLLLAENHLLVNCYDLWEPLGGGLDAEGGGGRSPPIIIIIIIIVNWFYIIASIRFIFISVWRIDEEKYWIRETFF